MPGNFESITVSSTAKGITDGVEGGHVNYAIITVESAAIRFRLDGTAPTAAIGHVVEAGGEIILATSGEIADFQAIRRDGVDATLRVSTFERLPGRVN